MTESLLSGLWAGYGLAVPVGAVAVLLVNTTARTSFGIGATAAMGAVTADGVYAVAATIGGTAVANATQPLAGPLRLAAGFILIAMAGRIVLTAIRPGERSSSAPAPASHLRSYLTYFGLTALNPWPAIYFAVLVMGRQGQHDSTLAKTAVYLLAILAASASWQLLLAASGAVLGRTVTSQRGQIITAAVSSLLIVTLSIRLLNDSTTGLT